MKVTAFEVNHGDAIKPAVGYRIDYKGHSAVISGDTRYNENVIKYGSGADLLIHAVAMARPALMQIPAIQRIIAHHTTPKEAGMVFSKVKPKLAVYTHIFRASNAQVSEPTLDQTYSGPREVGEDLTSFEIGDTVTVHHCKPEQTRAGVFKLASPVVRVRKSNPTRGAPRQLITWVDATGPTGKLG